MMGPREAARWLWRRWFGQFEIDDPRPIAAEAPYTFQLPSENELLALLPGDQVKLIVRSVPRSERYGAERMWLTIAASAGDRLRGVLDNVPFDMPQLRLGATIAFDRNCVIDLIWSDERTVAPPPSPKHREYWERCMVDDCVLEGRSPIDYLYREEPDLAAPEDRFPDSGWRIRGTDAAIAADEAAALVAQYVAVGAVLNRDDSWLALIDQPTGSRFLREETGGGFVEVFDEAS